jgi:hypothetical protein
MKKGKLKKFLSLFSGLAIGFAALLVSCVDPQVTPSAEFSYTLGNGAVEKTEYEYDDEDVVLNLYTTEAFYNNIYVSFIDNETTGDEDIDFEQTWNNNRNRLDVTLSGADYSKTCEYTIYASDKEDANIKDCISKTFKIVVDGNNTLYSTPVITTQPSGATYYYNASDSGPYYSDKDCTKEVTIAPLTVVATIASGEMSYQWYNTTGSISGATLSSYTPTAAGTYYVVVSNKDHPDSKVTSSTATIVFSNANNPTPTITTDIASASYDKIASAEPLTVVATVDSTKDGVLHAQWYKNGVATGSEVTNSAKTITTTLTPSEFGSYYVEIWNVIDGEESQKITSTIAVISENAITLTRDAPTSNVEITLDEENGNELVVSFTCNIDATLTYQWYFAEGESEESNSDTAEVITGATSSTYKATAVGTYFCKVTATSVADTNKTKSIESYHFYVTKQKLEGSGNIGIDFN